MHEHHGMPHLQLICHSHQVVPPVLQGLHPHSCLQHVLIHGLQLPTCMAATSASSAARSKGMPDGWLAAQHAVAAGTAHVQAALALLCCQEGMACRPAPSFRGQRYMQRTCRNACRILAVSAAKAADLSPQAVHQVKGASQAGTQICHHPSCFKEV